MRKALSLLALAVILSGCAPAPTFDASNSHQSAKAMQDALPASQRELFEASIGYLAAQRIFTPEMERLARSGQGDKAIEDQGRPSRSGRPQRQANHQAGWAFT